MGKERGGGAVLLEQRNGPRSKKYRKKETENRIETYQLVEVGLSSNCLTLIIETLKD